MNGNRIRMALVGRGPQLDDLLAGLDIRSHFLRLRVSHVVDLDAAPGNKELCRRLDLPAPSPRMAVLREGPRPGLILARGLTAQEEEELQRLAGPTTPVLGAGQDAFLQNLLQLMEKNRALALDSRRLKEIRRQLNLFVQTAPLAVYVKDTRHRYLLMNSHARHVLGLGKQDVAGQDDSQVYSGARVPWLRELEQAAMETGKILCATGTLPAPAQEMQAQVTIFPIVENGITTSLYGLIEDITELYEKERKLHKVDEQLDETQKYLREVLENSRDMIFLTDPDGSILSFNNGAVTSLGYSRQEIIGKPADSLCETPAEFTALFSKALREGHAVRYEARFRTRDGETVISNISLTLIRDAEERPRQGMERLHHQVERCTKITHSLLGFVRKDQAGIAPVDLEQILNESLNLLELAIHRSHATIQTLHDPEVPVIRSDPALLQQVFLNLLKNALDATEEVPERENRITIVTQWDSHRVIISIEDNGVGIPVENQERIFDLFHTTKPAGKGTGLGLSIVHDLLKRLGGNIRVASVPGKWTRFLVELPVVPPDDPQPDPTFLDL
ncbi:hypothetical protein CSA17_02130 [bacterium DOLJORAL78_65_58]|nr:MAG: hypothetical protein CSA17_02130 [bacterium DOLJORAL78_65_58]